MKPSVQKIITKLAKEKVDLSVGSDARRLINEFEKAEKGMLKQTNVLEKLLNQLKGFEQIKKELETQRKEALQFQNIYLDSKDKIDVVLNKLENYTKELGISVTEIPAYDLIVKSSNKAANAYRPLAELVIDARNILK